MPNRSVRLRHAIIGVGAGVFDAHRRALQLETAELAAVSDIDGQRGQQRATELGCVFFTDYHKMLTETRPDVAVILTPHPSHASIAIDCLEAGSHVLVEKPMAVQVVEADAMIHAAAQTSRLLAVNFQQRFRPEVQAARKLIQQGQVGSIQYVEMTETCTRTARYYGLAAWRGTWRGEGGGVLMNQAPHSLDLLCYLVGMPSRVVAWTRTQLHNIETEDTAQAMLEWPSGAWGSVHVSTAEAGRRQRLEIIGTRGHLTITPDGLACHQFDTDLREFVSHSPKPFAAPEEHRMAIELVPGVGDHTAVYRDLHAAILQGQPLMSDGVEGRMSLELANAIVFSSHTREQVQLPLDRQEYAALLEDLVNRHRSIGER
jgi:predicted dehydrogenase